jgi:hypothetical protein
VTGMTRDQIVCCVASLAEVLIGCALVFAATTPTQILLCGLVVTIGVAAFALSIKE